MKQDVAQNMEPLSRAILSEAQGEADQILAEAREKADAILEQARAQADDERKRILDRAKQEADRIHGQTIATTQLKTRTMQLEHREQMLNKVFEEARKELPNVQQWSDYEEIAQSLLREALDQFRAREVRLRADRHTLSLFSKGFLEKISQERDIKITLGETLKNEVGVIVETMDGHMQFDNTLETRLNRMQNGMRAQVYRLLMGEGV